MCVCACRYLEEYLDSKRPLSPLSPLSDCPESNKLSTKTKNAEVHHVHTHKNKDKNRDSAVKVTPKDLRLLHPSHFYLPPFGLFLLFLTCTLSLRWRWNVLKCQDRPSHHLSPGVLQDTGGPCQTTKREQ